MSNNFKNIIIVSLVGLSNNQFSHAQNLKTEVTVHLTETNDSSYFIVDANIYLLVLKDTIAKGKTDKNGSYQWTGELAKGARIKVITDHDFYSRSEDLTTEINIPTSFDIHLQLIPKRSEFLYPPVFIIDKKEIVTDFDVDYFNHQFLRFNQMCIEFTLFQLPGESSKLAEKRKNMFSKYLIEHGLDADKFKFSPNFKVLECETSSECKPRIEGKIHSLESICNLNFN